VKVVPSFPLLGKELLELAARRRTYVLRAVYALLFFGIFLLIYYQTLATRGPNILSMLGSGRDLFEVIVHLQFAGIYLFLPAMTCGAIASEKENQSLPLLFLTGMRPANILIEKGLGRLIPMGTFLLLSLPLMGLCYRFGGVTTEMMATGIYTLVLAVLQVAAISLFCSAWCRTTTQAFFCAYLLGTLLYLALPTAVWLLDGLFEIPDKTAYALFPPYLYDASRWSPYASYLGSSALFGTPSPPPSPGLGDIAVQSLPIWLSILLFALGSRLVLVPRAFVQPKDRMLSLFRRLDGVMKDWNRRLGGFMLVREKDSLPVDEPVAWREMTQRLLGRANYLVRIVLLIEVPLLLLVFLVLTQSDFRYNIPELFLTLAVSFWSLAALTIVVKSAGAIASERVAGTLDVLATTPMAGADILRQKMRGITRLMLAVSVPLLTVVLIHAWVGGPIKGDPLDWLVYVLGSAATMAIYFPMLSWGALSIGLRSRTQARAILAALTLLAGWMALAPAIYLVVDVVFPQDTSRYDPYTGYTHSVKPYIVLPEEIRLGMLSSPATIIAILELDAAREFNSSTVTLVAMNSALYGLLWWFFRDRCLLNADRFLGRGR
jgi:ABC-type transport system involved in multi-copper enzyme maturation permease subunit